MDVLGSRLWETVRDAVVPPAVRATAERFAAQVAQVLPAAPSQPADRSEAKGYREAGFTAIQLPDVRRETVAGVVSSDLVGNDARRGQHYDVGGAMTSWDQFPALLQRLRAGQLRDGQHITLAMTAHGNSGTGFKLLGRTGHEEAASVASAAWINDQLRQAGFTPADITIVAESCNGGSSYRTTVDGMNSAERTTARQTAERLATSHGYQLTNFQVFDVLGDNPTSDALAPSDRSFNWVGRASGTTIGMAFVQWATGVGVPGAAEDGAAQRRAGPSRGVPGVRVPEGHRLSLFNRAPDSQLRYSGGLIAWSRRDEGRMLKQLQAQAPRLVHPEAPAPGPSPAETPNVPVSTRRAVIGRAPQLVQQLQTPASPGALVHSLD